MRNKMVSTILVLSLLLTGQLARAQEKKIAPASPAADSTLQALYLQKAADLSLLGRVWGFLKYFHPAVASGGLDWDKALLEFVPGYLQTKSKQERNDSLLAWIDRIGEVPAARAGDYKNIREYKLKPDFSWISDKTFGKTLKNRLIHILENRKQGDQYYIKFHRTEGVNLPDFDTEKKYPERQLPTIGLRLLALYRFWNIIEYWYPYKYNLPLNWNQVLRDQLGYFIQAASPREYAYAVKRMITTIHDGHGYFFSMTSYTMDGNYYLPVRFKYVQDKVIVSSISNDSIAAKANLKLGDVIVAMDGVKTEEIIRQRLPLTSGSTRAYQLYSICMDLNRTTKATTLLEVNNGVQTRKVEVANKFTMQPIDQYVSSFSYQKDSTLSLLKNNIAYLNMGQMTMKHDSANLVRLVAESRAIIVDLRQNAIEDPNRENTVQLLEDLICNGEQPYVFSTGQPDYAGVFKLAKDTTPPYRPHPVKYNKPVVVLINEEAKSIGEFMAMIFGKAPQAVLMGSATAGADGPVSNVYLPGSTYVMFTGTGVYWKDGKETQRTGIQPTINVTPTIEGYRNNQDEVLQKAIDYLSPKK